MVYLNFNKITPAVPNDPLVNEQTQLNDNWTQLDTKLSPYPNQTTPTGMEAGQEYFDGTGRFAVWDGAAIRLPDDIDSAWSAWTTMPILAPRVARSGFILKWRNNSLLRKVELNGGVQADGVASAWTLGTLFAYNSDTAGAIPASMTPIGGTHVSQAAAGLSAGTTVVAAGYIYVDKPGGNTFVRVRGQYLGGPGGGNFVMCDQVSWWY